MTESERPPFVVAIYQGEPGAGPRVDGPFKEYKSAKEYADKLDRQGFKTNIQYLYRPE